MYPIGVIDKEAVLVEIKMYRRCASNKDASPPFYWNVRMHVRMADSDSAMCSYEKQDIFVRDDDGLYDSLSMLFDSCRTRAAQIEGFQPFRKMEVLTDSTDIEKDLQLTCNEYGLDSTFILRGKHYSDTSMTFLSNLPDFNGAREIRYYGRGSIKYACIRFTDWSREKIHIRLDREKTDGGLSIDPTAWHGKSVDVFVAL